MRNLLVVLFVSVVWSLFVWSLWVSSDSEGGSPVRIGEVLVFAGPARRAPPPTPCVVCKSAFGENVR